MAYEINADKYAFAQTPQPEKVCENYNAVLIRKLVQEEADKREALKNALEQNIANEVFARTDGDIDLKEQLDAEVVRLSELETELVKNLEKKANIADVYSKEQAKEAFANKSDVENVLKLDETVRRVSEIKEDKVTILNINNVSEYCWNGPDNHNTETRILTPALDLLCVEWWSGEYPEDYHASLSFNSGAVPTTVSYPMGGLINWVGTDCVVSDGVSVFQPSENTHYEVVIYYNGTQCIGLVNGFIPSSQEADAS